LRVTGIFLQNSGPAVKLEVAPTLVFSDGSHSPFLGARRTSAMQAILQVVLCAATVAPAFGGAPGKDQPVPWKEWGVLAPKEDVTPRALAYAPSGKTVAAAGTDNKIRLWNTLIGREEGSFDAKKIGPLLALRYDVKGERLFAAGERGMLAWDVKTGKVVEDFPIKSSGIVAAALHPDGKTVAVGSSEAWGEVWELGAAKARLWLQDVNPAGWSALAFSADGALLATGTTDGNVAVRKTADGTAVARIQRKAAGAVRALAFAPDGKHLAVVRGREPVSLWSVPEGKLVKELPGAAPPYHTVAFAPQAGLIAAGTGGGAVHLWNTAGEQVENFKAHAGQVSALAFGPDGLTLGSGSNDGTLHLWDGHKTVKLPEIKLTQPDLDSLLTDLTIENEVNGSRAVMLLTAAGPQSLPALKKALKQGKEPDVKQVRKWIEDLSSETFAVRNKATKELTAHGQAIRSELREALTNKKMDLETTRRIETLLNRLVEEKYTPEERRLTMRALVILERIGNEEARAILNGLLWGAGDDEILAATRAVLVRLGK
jgi:WD40 repeat protein